MYRIQTWSGRARFALLRALTRAWGQALGRAPSALDGAYAMRDALTRAVVLGELAADIGFDWVSPKDALDKVREEVDEVDEALDGGARDEIFDELGDLLFAACMVARKADIDPEAALKVASAKFARRFRAIEDVMRERGVRGQDLELDALEDIWTEVKRRERAGVT